MMTKEEQRAAVEAHPPMPVRADNQRNETYDLREIALWILDNPTPAQYRLSDWWHGGVRTTGPEWAQGGPKYFLGFTMELGAYRLIERACRGEVYAPDDLDLMLRGGAPMERVVANG